MSRCPKCGADPFAHFLRWQVVRTLSLGRFFRNLWHVIRAGGESPLRGVGDFAVICRACKEIVGYES